MYTIEIDPEARAQIDALPPGALIALAEAMAMLELTPWNGSPQHKGNPNGALQRIVFAGTGMVIYLILEDQRRVDVLDVVWVVPTWGTCRRK